MFDTVSESFWVIHYSELIRVTCWGVTVHTVNNHFWFPKEPLSDQFLKSFFFPEFNNLKNRFALLRTMNVKVSSLNHRCQSRSFSFPERPDSLTRLRKYPKIPVFIILHQLVHVQHWILLIRYEEPRRHARSSGEHQTLPLVRGAILRLKQVNHRPSQQLIRQTSVTDPKRGDLPGENLQVLNPLVFEDLQAVNAVHSVVLDEVERRVDRHLD